jgi:hypothetical protein
MKELFESKRNIILGGEHLEQRFRDRGFIDVRVLQKDIVLGDWNTSTQILDEGLTVAPKTAAYGRAARTVWIGALCAMVEHLSDYYPDKTKRQEMADKVKADLCNPNYHFFCPMYKP